MLAAFRDPARAAAVGERARRLAEARYSDEAYLAKTQRACDLLFGPVASEAERGVA